MKTAVAAVLGVASLLGAVALLLSGSRSGSGDALRFALVVLVAVVGSVGVLVAVQGSRFDGSAAAAAPWTDDGALVDDAPERSPARADVSGQSLAAVVEEACATARRDGTVAAGVDVVRPPLREALLDVLVRGGTDREAAERAIETGAWTDDGTAAAVLAAGVDRPGRSLWERFEAWLFPEQVVRSETGRAMAAVAAVAEAELPTVPGQRAPRTVPVVQPTLEDLRRSADGTLQRAVDPLDASRGSRVNGTRRVYDATTVRPDSDGDAGGVDEPVTRDTPDHDRHPSSTDPRGSDRRALDDVPIGRDGETRDHERTEGTRR